MTANNDEHVKEAFAAAKAAYDHPELRAENERLRVALMFFLEERYGNEAEKILAQIASPETV